MLYRTVAVLALSLAATGLDAAPVELKIATVAPDGSSWVEALRRAATEVEQGTEGRVRLRLYPGGAMGGDQTMLRKIRIGQLHGAAVTSGALASISHDLEAYGLPLLFRSEAEVEAIRARFDPRLTASIEAGGFVCFGFSGNGFAFLMSTRPVRSFEDLKGRKAWLPEGDEVGRTTLEAVGLVPVPLGVADVLTGLQTGLVDTVAGPPVAAVALQWFTKADHLVDLPLLYTFGGLVVSDKAFARIGTADQAAVREILSRVIRDLDRRSWQDNHGAREALVKQGVEILIPSSEVAQRWAEVARDARATLSRRLEIDPDLAREIDAALAELRAADAAK